MKNKVTVVFVLLLIGTAAARADSIIYQFTDFLVPGGFTYVTPTFITTTITVPASDLTACTSSGGPILSGCSGVIFKPNSDSADSIEFLRGGFGEVFFYFYPIGTFANLGTHNEPLGVGTIRSSLVITETAIPEPSTLMLLGTGLVGVALKARRKLFH